MGKKTKQGISFYYQVQLQVQPNSLASSRPSSPISQAGLALQFSDIIAKKVRVIVDPVRVLDEVVWSGI